MSLLCASCYILFQKPFPNPSETVPAAEEDEASDVLVKGEDGPHGHEAPSHADAEDIASDYLYAPHNDDSHAYRVIDVTRASEGVHAEEIEGTAVFKQHFDPQY